MADNVLPTDHFSICLRQLSERPDALKAESTIHTRDFYGNTASWIVRTFRADGQVWTFLQRSGAAGDNLREVLTPEVTAAIASQLSRLITRTRKIAARKAVATKRVAGTPIGNVEALRRARKKGAR